MRSDRSPGQQGVLAQLYPTKGSEELYEQLGVWWSGSRLRTTLAELGLSRARGRPGGSRALKAEEPPEEGEGKDLREMRVAPSSLEARHRKDVALTLFPVVLGTPRWVGLQHGSRALLESLVGHSYMPLTLDKHARRRRPAAPSGRDPR